MPSSTFNATSMRYSPGSGWTSGQARQGQYNGSTYRGEINFDFGGTAFTSNINITQITLNFTVGNIGGSYTKYLYLKAGSWNSSTSVGNYSFSSCYNSSKSKTFSASSNASGFNVLKSHIEGGGTRLGIYTSSSRGGSSSKSFDYDYMNITAMSLTITYTYKKSIGSVEGAETGSASVLSITAFNASYKHKVTWSLGNNEPEVQTIDSGSLTPSTSFVIPHSWLPNSESGTVNVLLETIDSNDISLGSNTYEFITSVPSTIVPTIGSITASPVNAGASDTAASWGLYIQNLTKASVTINNAAPGAYATITSYSIVSSPNYGSSSTNSLQSDILSGSGNVSFTGIVTDSRGRSASADVTINVQAYSSPTFTTTPSTYRCDSSGNRNDTDGRYACVLATFGVSSITDSSYVEKNGITLKTISVNNITTNIADGATFTIVGNDSLSVDSSYDAEIKIKDIVGSESVYVVTVPSAKYLIHFRAGGRSIGIFRAAGGTDDDTVHVGGYLSMSDHPIGVESGGTNANNRVEAADNLLYLGSNITEGTSNDTPEFWAEVGNGYAWFDTLNQLNGQPNQYGFLKNYVRGSEVHQEWFSQPNGNHYKRGADGNSATMPTWSQVWTSDNLVPITSGGTNANNAADAKKNLGADSATYQTGEIETGGTWIDGKPIYRYVISGTNSICNTYGVVGTLPSGVDSLVRVWGYSIHPTSTNQTRYPIPNTMYNTNTAIYNTGVTVRSNGEVTVHYGSGWVGDRPHVVIVEYTKVSV